MHEGRGASANLEVDGDALCGLLVALKGGADAQRARRQVPRPEALQVVPGDREEAAAVAVVALARGAAVRPDQAPLACISPSGPGANDLQVERTVKCSRSD